VNETAVAMRDASILLQMGVVTFEQVARAEVLQPQRPELLRERRSPLDNRDNEFFGQRVHQPPAYFVHNVHIQMQLAWIWFLMFHSTRENRGDRNRDDRIAQNWTDAQRLTPTKEQFDRLLRSVLSEPPGRNVMRAIRKPALNKTEHRGRNNRNQLNRSVVLAHDSV
jgi:hypothetical protein